MLARFASFVGIVALGASSLVLADDKVKAPPIKRILVIPFDAVGVDSSLVTPLPNLVDSELGKYHGYDVVGADDLHNMATAQEQKRQGGCAQDAECLTEIGAKLNADLILTGSVGQVGSDYVLTLTLGDPKGLATAQRATETTRTPEGIASSIPACVAKLLGPPAAAPPFHLPQGKKLSFAIFDLKPTGLTPQIAQNLTQVLSTEVKGIEGASVISREDIASMLQLDQAKMQTGCTDDACAAIGGALGVDRIITGDAGKVGTLFIVNLRLIDERKGVVENRVTETFEGEEEQLLRAVRKAARDLLGLASQGTGELTVTATQNNAEVSVDGSAPLKAPARLMDLEAVRHSVRVTAPGCFDWHGDVYVDPLETTAVWAQLNTKPWHWYEQWWVWTAAGGVALIATSAAVAFTHPPGAGNISVLTTGAR